jgi:hypothetical protein
VKLLLDCHELLWALLEPQLAAGATPFTWIVVKMVVKST